MIEALRRFLEAGVAVYERPPDGCAYPLDKNENLLVPKGLVAELMAKAAFRLDPRLYQGGEEEELCALLAERFSADRDMVNVTNGADDAIDLLVSLATVLAGGRPRVLVLRPSFPMYHVRAKLRGCLVEDLGLSERGFSVDVCEAAEKASRADLVFLCSPNNPTGNLLERGLVEAVAESTRGLVVVDQTYVEFSDGGQPVPFGRYENLVLVGTFSKAYGLAGLRLGYVVAPPDVSKALGALRLPYHVSRFSMLVGVEALKLRGVFAGYVEEAKRLRRTLFSKLKGVGYLEPYETQTNFVFARCAADLGVVESELASRGICVRTYRGLFREGDQYLRVTVAPEHVIDLVVEALGAVEL